VFLEVLMDIFSFFLKYMTNAELLVAIKEGNFMTSILDQGSQH
jgi:hypothetical protein